ncbi:MAG TPA: hypothetical protein ENO09_05845 [bacterium]|nr:hypothetical protein [bacterium]
MSITQSLIAKMDNLQFQINQMRAEIMALGKPRCKTCIYWQGEECAKYQATPPQEIIDNGCEGWEFNDVPF